MVEFKEYKRLPDKKYYIEYVVLKNICRVLKDYKLFTRFRSPIGFYTGTKMGFLYSHFYKNNPRIVNVLDHNPFCICKTLEDVLKVMSGGNIIQNYDDEGKIQRKITNCINILLHTLLEKQMDGNIRILEEIGGKTFDITCKELFGENFVDKTIPEGVDIEIIKKASELVRNGHMESVTPEMKKQLDIFFRQMNQERAEQEEFLEFPDGEEEEFEGWDDGDEAPW